MNFRKALGISVLLSFAACDTILSKGLTCEHAKDPINKLFVRDSPAPKPSVSTPHVHQFFEPQAKPIQSFVPLNPSKQHSQGHSHQVENRVPQKPVVSYAKHIHTEYNAPGAISNRKTVWQQNQRNHETSESYDKSGCIHQVHKWKDGKGRKHETDQWSDEHENVHQCHRYQDDDGCVHQSIQVTDIDGKVANEHFKKDKNGKITKVEKGQEERPTEQKASVPSIATEVQIKGVLHAPNCPDLQKNQ